MSSSSSSSSEHVNHALDGQSASGLMIGLSAGLGLLCMLIVAARIYTRAILLRMTGLDDIMIVITQILATGLNISTILEGHFGVGRHSWVSSPQDAIRQLQCLFAAIQLYIWALACVKVSLLLQYRRIFLISWLHRISIIIIAFAVAWNIAQSILVSFACVPMGTLHPSMANTCLDSLTIWYIAAGINITTDFIVFLLPIPLINSLQLPPRQKFLLCLVFGLGLFTCVISIVRVTTLHLVVSKNDPSWYGTQGATWSMVEVNCAILCSCLPTIRYLLAQLFPCLGLRNESSKYGGEAPSGSRRRTRHASGIVLRPLKDKKSYSQSLRPSQATSKTSRASGVPDGPAVDDLETRWGIDVEKSGLYYHSNHITAWVSANAEAGSSNSPIRTQRQSDDGGSERGLVEHSVSDRDLGQHILVTKSMVVQENRVEPPGTTPGI